MASTYLAVLFFTARSLEPVSMIKCVHSFVKSLAPRNAASASTAAIFRSTSASLASCAPFCRLALELYAMTMDGVARSGCVAANAEATTSRSSFENRLTNHAFLCPLGAGAPYTSLYTPRNCVRFIDSNLGADGVGVPPSSRCETSAVDALNTRRFKSSSSASTARISSTNRQHSRIVSSLFAARASASIAPTSALSTSMSSLSSPPIARIVANASRNSTSTLLKFSTNPFNV